MRGLLTTVGLLATVGCASSTMQVGPASPAAHAQAKDLAREAYDVAVAADGDRGALAEAIRLTKRAYAIDRDPLYLCNIGGYYRMLDDWPRAASFLGRCLQLLPATRPAELDRFRAVLADVEDEVRDDHVAILVDVQPAALIRVSTFASDEVVPSPAVVWLPVGTHTITATIPGQGPRTKTISVTPTMLEHDRRQAVVLR
jgi:hypothetical protein